MGLFLLTGLPRQAQMSKWKITHFLSLNVFLQSQAASEFHKHNCAKTHILLSSSFNAPRRASGTGSPALNSFTHKRFWVNNMYHSGPKLTAPNRADTFFNHSRYGAAGAFTQKHIWVTTQVLKIRMNFQTVSQRATSFELRQLHSNEYILVPALFWRGLLTA